MSYSTIQFNIKKGDTLYGYCDDITHGACNLRNAALFRLRQVYTLVHKPLDKLTQNEMEVYKEILNAVKEFPEICYIPTKKKYKLSYRYLDKLMRENDNPDFFDKRLPRQTSQQILKGVVREMKVYYNSTKSYNKDASKFLGKAKLPKYKKHGSAITVKMANQDCVIYPKNDGTHNVKLPLIDMRYDIGDTPVDGKKLKEASIILYHIMIFIYFHLFLKMILMLRWLVKSQREYVPLIWE